MPTAAAHGNHLGPFVSIGVRASPTCILIALVRCGALFPRAASAGKALLYTIPLCDRSFPGHFFSSLSRPVSYSSFLIPFPSEISTNEQKTRSGRSRFPLPRGGESPEARAGSPGRQLLFCSDLAGTLGKALHLGFLICNIKGLDLVICPAPSQLWDSVMGFQALRAAAKPRRHTAPAPLCPICCFLPQNNFYLMSLSPYAPPVSPVFLACV